MAAKSGERRHQRDEHGAMRQYSHSGGQPSKHQLMRRLDRAFGELNVFLTAVAIGLALLDVACLYGVALGEPLQQAFHNERAYTAGWPGLLLPRHHSGDSSN
jgi:hypothetical protein